MIDYWKELQFEILVKVDFMIALRPLLMKLLTNNAKFNFFIAEGLASLGTSSSLWYLSSLESDSQRPKFRSATDPHRPISRLSLFLLNVIECFYKTPLFDFCSLRFWQPVPVTYVFSVVDQPWSLENNEAQICGYHTIGSIHRPSRNWNSFSKLT